MRSPPSTLSSRNAPPSARSFANAETGVSRSASRSRTTGTSVRVFVFVVSTVVMSCLLAQNKNPRPITGRGLVVPPDLGPPSLADPQPPLSRSALSNGGLPGVASADLRFATPSRGTHSRRFRRPGLTPRPGSLAGTHGLIAPARATFPQILAPVQSQGLAPVTPHVRRRRDAVSRPCDPSRAPAARRASQPLAATLRE